MIEKIIDNKVRPAIFQKKIEISKGVFEVYFKVEGSFEYKSGQYAWLQLPNMKYEDIKGDRRAFSIINPQNTENTISFLFRDSGSNFKKSFLELKEGDKVNVIGPFGHSFSLPEKEESELVFISGGIGISPFINLIRFINEKKLNYKISLLSFGKEKLYEKEIKSIKNKNFDFQFFEERPSFADFKKIKKANIFYISGTQGFIDSVHNLLKENEIEDNQMRFENFYPQKENKELIELLKKEVDINPEEGSVLLSAIKSTSHHIVITDKNGIIMFANASAQKITGFSFAEMQNNTPRLWGGLMSEEFYKKLWLSKNEGSVIDEEIINRRKNHQLYNVISHISPIKDYKGDIVGFIATEEDITKIKEKEAEILKTNEELERFTLSMADREIKMIELKKELEKIKKQLDELKK